MPGPEKALRGQENCPHGLPDRFRDSGYGAPDRLGMTRPGHRLDPEDWPGFRKEMHRLLDQCLDRLESARNLPWRPPPEDFPERLEVGGGGAPTIGRMVEEIMPFATGNTHPRFFGWVHGSGLPIGVAAEMVAATMNSNLGGRFHGAVEVERAVIRWVRGVAGMPEEAFGILTTGTSQATLLALAAARTARFGPGIRREGVAAFPAIRVYASTDAHSCVVKALEALGHGSAALRKIPLDGRGAIWLDALAGAVAEDRAAGLEPLAVAGTAGSVNLGSFDPLDELAAFCAEEGMWLHVDAAFGFWTLLAGSPWNVLPKGIGRADSVAADFHKWIGAPYDCGICLTRDGEMLRAAFAERPDYLARGEALAGGEPWFCDYGIDLSRGFRALKVWAAADHHGVEALGAAVADNCRQAAMMGRLAEESGHLDLARPVVSNVCVMRPRAGRAADISAALQRSGDAVFSTTKIDGEDCLRAAIANHRTTDEDVREAIAALEREIARHA